ncbi:hypothetical protein KFL_005300120, partial [Klebsormidium nitens]
MATTPASEPVALVEQAKGTEGGALGGTLSGVAIKTGLENFFGVERITFHPNYLELVGPLRLDQEGVELLAEALKGHPRLKSLILREVELDWGHFKGNLGLALEQMNDLHSLDLTLSTFSGDFAGSGFSKLIESKTLLVSLVMHNVNGLKVGDLLEILKTTTSRDFPLALSIRADSWQLEDLEALAREWPDGTMVKIEGLIGSLLDCLRGGCEELNMDLHSRATKLDNTSVRELISTIETYGEVTSIELPWKSKALRTQLLLACERNKRLQGLWEVASEDELVRIDSLWGKVFLCGDGYAGKSTLTKSLVRRKGLFAACLQPSEGAFVSAFVSNQYVAIRGIALAKYQAVYEGKGAQLVFWDLAGQKEYQVLHSSLLANEGKATSYVLVSRIDNDIQAQKGDKSGSPLAELPVRIRWWLDLVASYSQVGNERAVVLVFNEVGNQQARREKLERLADELRSSYQDKLKILEEVYFLDTRHHKSAGVRALQLKLLALTEEATKPTPKVCLELQTTLTGFRKSGRFPVQTWEEFKGLMRRGVGEELLKGVTAYLHEMGKVVYFRSGPLSG